MNRMFFVVLVAILAGLMFVSAASAKIGFMSIGGRVGYVKPEDPIDGTFGIGVVADLGTIVPALGLEGSVDYWSKSYDVGFMGFDESWTWSDIMIGATAKYMIPTQGSVMPYVGGGLALHMFKWDWECNYDEMYGEYYDDVCDGSDTETDIGFHAVGGIETKLSPNLRGGIEGRYAIADPDHFGIFGKLTYVVAP
jgi:opacity protein-like surface antigen